MWNIQPAFWRLLSIKNNFCPPWSGSIATWSNHSESLLSYAFGLCKTAHWRLKTPFCPPVVHSTFRFARTAHPHGSLTGKSESECLAFQEYQMAHTPCRKCLRSFLLFDALVRRTSLVTRGSSEVIPLRWDHCARPESHRCPCVLHTVRGFLSLRLTTHE